MTASLFPATQIRHPDFCSINETVDRDRRERPRAHPTSRSAAAAIVGEPKKLVRRKSDRSA
jgi:hypothetical protein